MYSLVKVDSLHYIYRIHSQKKWIPFVTYAGSLENVNSYILLRYRHTNNERHSSIIATLGSPRLDRSIHTLIGSFRIGYLFKIKARRF